MSDFEDVRSLPLVLLPGTLCDGRLFDGLIGRLAGVRSQVVEFAGTVSIREAALSVLRQVPGQFSLLGFSLGGMVALEMALLAPERVRGLVLLSTSPLPVPSDRHAMRRAAVQEAGGMALGQFIETRLAAEYGASPNCMELIAAMAEAKGHAEFTRQTEMALGRPDFRSSLPAIGCHTLVIAGDEDRLCPPAAQQAFVAGLPHSTLCMIPGVGHLCLLQRPDEVACAVAAWLHTIQRTQETE